MKNENKTNHGVKQVAPIEATLGKFKPLHETDYSYNEYVKHDVQLNQKEMSLIEWGLNSLFSFNLSAQEREQVEQLLEKLNDC